ncbi:succinate dehydrogenase assembly factor 2, mitochondrial-like [Daktulosphaira vitifoliae]|uniref:succinate dehydrogenase assembly factor 2, mitochondrial-like n=1 Tax=Daktulosphaira vitifoliae TaxID=58002 RepID=UPI0021AACBFC|nr:succinate dehydrogenase assembly factor 2, mitochondrial-like [Daktulosphaira vitifoliae]
MNNLLIKSFAHLKRSSWNNIHIQSISYSAVKNYPQHAKNTSKDTNVDLLRNRLIYQSRKRGTLENCIIFSTFADKYLKNFDDAQLKKYDALINSTFDEWELYAWAIGSKPSPKEFDNDVMHLLVSHTTREKNNSS